MSKLQGNLFGQGTLIRRTQMTNVAPRRWRLWTTVLGAVAAGLLLSHAAVADDEKARPATGTQPSAHKPSVQTECPVMIGNAIDPNILTIYKGKKVYFCCPSCKAAFEKDPEKYLPRLPQFTQAAGELEDGHSSERESHFTVAELIEPMGIATLSLVTVTVALGLFRRRNPIVMLRWHKRFGPAALVAGAIHAALVIFAY